LIKQKEMTKSGKKDQKSQPVETIVASVRERNNEKKKKPKNSVASVETTKTERGHASRCRNFRLRSRKRGTLPRRKNQTEEQTIQTNKRVAKKEKQKRTDSRLPREQEKQRGHAESVPGRGVSSRMQAARGLRQ